LGGLKKIEPDDAIGPQELAKAANSRLELCRLEQRFFKTPHQISFELLLYLVANHGEVKLADAYNYLAATDASIRQHLRSLEELGLLIVKNHVKDQRARRIIMTKHGYETFTQYLEGLRTMNDSPNI
jgi:DNA-binding MarR family transcriptional regulator